MLNPSEVALTAYAFLLQGDEVDAATMLARCDVRIEDGYNSFGESCPVILLIGDRKAYEAFRDYQSETYKQVREAFTAAMGDGGFDIEPRFAVKVENGWVAQAPPLPSGGVIEAEYAEVD
jgi:hypothetical protein